MCSLESWTGVTENERSGEWWWNDEWGLRGGWIWSCEKGRMGGEPTFEKMADQVWRWKSLYFVSAAVEA